MSVEAVPIIPLVRRQRPATAQVKLPPHQSQSAPQCSGVRERTKITGAIVLLKPGESKSGDRVVQIDLEQQESFVIAKADVVTRMKLLDQLALEQQRFRFAAHQVKIKIVNSFHERFEFQIPTYPPRRLEILGHALAQIPGFANINNRPEPVAHQVDARFMRQAADLLANVLCQFHSKFESNFRGQFGCRLTIEYWHPTLRRKWTLLTENLRSLKFRVTLLATCKVERSSSPLDKTGLL